jgi:DNA-binding NarL/FixJ family response regulator
MTKTRVVLADDHRDLLTEIERLLTPEFDIIATAQDGVALLEVTAELKPDVVITDVEMPRMGGLDASRAILRQGLCKAIVVLSMHGEPLVVKRALGAGVQGFVLKTDAGDELSPAVNTAIGGGTYLSQGILDKWAGQV